MLHRYQVEAASKLVGGMDYTFALRGDAQTPTQIVAAAEQRRALAAVLATLNPEVLALPEPLLKLIPPRPVGYPRGREDFKIRTSPAFDALAPAEAAAQHTLQFLFNPERATRLVEFHARDAANPGLDEVFNQIFTATGTWSRSPGYPGELGRVVDSVALYDLMVLANDAKALVQARALAATELDRLKQALAAAAATEQDPAVRAHFFFGAAEIEQFQKDPSKLNLTPPSEPPDGPPIGTDDDFEFF
jgi:hypothetical protein